MRHARRASSHCIFHPPTPRRAERSAVAEVLVVVAVEQVETLRLVDPARAGEGGWRQEELLQTVTDRPSWMPTGRQRADTRWRRRAAGGRAAGGRVRTPAGWRAGAGDGHVGPRPLGGGPEGSEAHFSRGKSLTLGKRTIMKCSERKLHSTYGGSRWSTIRRCGPSLGFRRNSPTPLGCARPAGTTTSLPDAPACAMVCSSWSRGRKRVRTCEGEEG